MSTVTYKCLSSFINADFMSKKTKDEDIEQRAFRPTVPTL